MEESLELDPIGSDGEEVDEETGLTGKERQKYLQRKKRQDALDARIGGAHGLSVDDRKAADRNVMRKIIVNTMLIAAWYVFSLSISLVRSPSSPPAYHQLTHQQYNKWMFSGDHLDFHFPMFTTSLHMIVQFLLASIILLIFPSLRPSVPSNPHGETKPLVTPLFYFTRLVPTGTTTSLDIGLGNTSLRYITLTFYTMCKSSVLIFVLSFAFIFRLEKPSLKLILIILTMTGGVLMMVFGETAFHALGFALAMSASFFSGFRWGLTQILMLRHPATANPFATLFFLAPIMFATLFIIAMFAESPSAIVSGLHILVAEQGLAKSLVLLIIPGSLAFCMISAEFTLLQRTSVVTLSICGIFKEVVTISAAGIIFHDELSFINVSGLLVTIACIAYYNYFKVTKMREEARAKLARKEDDEINGVGSPEVDQEAFTEAGLVEREGSMDGDGRDDEDASGESSQRGTRS
jgi:solute carrier family 35, member C2